MSSSSQRHRSHRYSQSASPTANPPQSSLTHLRVSHSGGVHRIRTNNTPPPPPSDSDANDDAFLERNILRNLDITQQLNIPRLPRPRIPTTSQSNPTGDNDQDDVVYPSISSSSTSSRRPHQLSRRLHPSPLVSRSLQQQFSPPPSTHAAPLLLGNENVEFIYNIHK